jgi:biopolymer transport protein ExbD
MAMSAGGDPSRPEMKVTPLIDVLLVFIIIFMVIVVEQGNKGLTAQPLPSTDPAHPGVQRTIVAQLVSVPGQDQQPTLKINQQNVDWNNLEPLTPARVCNACRESRIRARRSGC